MGWNPSEFPPLPDAEVLEQHAGKLRTKAEGIQSAASESHSIWQGTAAAYKGPGDWQVHSAFNRVLTEADTVLEDSNSVADAIDTYAEWAREAKQRYNALYSDWLSVRARIADEGDDWRKNEDLVNDDNQILKDANVLVEDHMAAERACASAISGLFGGPSYVVTTEDGPGTNQVAYGYTSEQLDAATAEGHIPWGEPTEWDKPWYRDAWDGVVSFGKGVWSGITGTVTGLWNMVNFTDMDTFSATWKGIGQLALDVAIVTTPMAQVALRATGNGRIADQAGERLVAVGKAAIHWDDWKRDPAYAAGATTFDLASILLTAGGGAVAKTGSVASAVTRIGQTGSKIGSVVNVTGLSRMAGLTTKVLDLGSSLKVNTINFATDSARVTLGRMAPAAVRVDNFLNDVGNTLSGPRPAYAGVATGHGPGPVSTRIDNLINRFDAEGPSRPNRGPAPDTTPVRTTARSGTDTHAVRGSGSAAAPDTNSAPVRGATATPDTDTPASRNAGSAGHADSDAPAREPNGSAADTDAASYVPDSGDNRTPAAGTPEAEAPADRNVAADGSAGPVPGTDTSGTPAAGELIRDADGNPSVVRFPDGTEHKVATNLSNLRQADAWDDVREALERSGRDEDWLRDVVGRQVEELSPEDAAALHDIRRSIPAPDTATVFQKVMDRGSADALFDASNPYRGGAMGYISRAEHTAGLRTPADIHDGLRLDYDNTPYRPDNSQPVYAVRFQGTADSIGNVRVPDGRMMDALHGPDAPHARRDAPDDYSTPSPHRDASPNTGHGFTSSTSSNGDLIPEEATHRDIGAVQYQKGAEMWEINGSGKETLTGVYNGNTWDRVAEFDGGSGRSPSGAPTPGPSAGQQLIDAARPEIVREVPVEGLRKTEVFSARTDLEPNTLYDVSGRGKFYTDGDGKVVLVETSTKRFGRLNPDLQNPLPNATYHVNDYMVVKTDDLGRTVHTHVDALSLADGGRHRMNQTEVGHIGNAELNGGKDIRLDENGAKRPYSEYQHQAKYEGGHGLGRAFGGIREWLNYTPMSKILNGGRTGIASFFRVERELEALLRANPGTSIEFDVRNLFRGESQVPHRYTVRYSIDGAKPKVLRLTNRV
ncbi:DNA/RNA non-specific endonuclease [Arthrobacter sp. USHLN218]|uniref:DNA/RNA non-specific endonuclease n=1 Tax=Arthrobacter sp. USHLN218 TaxID=3081232 RepID=UPI003018826E